MAPSGAWTLASEPQPPWNTICRRIRWRRCGGCPFARRVAGSRSYGLAGLIEPPDVKQARSCQIMCTLWCHLPSKVTPSSAEFELQRIKLPLFACTVKCYPFNGPLLDGGCMKCRTLLDSGNRHYCAAAVRLRASDSVRPELRMIGIGVLFGAAGV